MRFNFFLFALLCYCLSALADNTSAIQSSLLTQSLLLDVKRISDKKLVVVGERGHIAISSDNGDRWRQAQVPSRATLTAVYFHDQKLGWAVGHDATILRTRDGGGHWSRIHHAPEKERPLFDVWFRDASYGIAVGAYGYLLVTSDGGDSWREQAFSEDDFHLNQILLSKTGRLYIAAEAGNIYRSDNQGKTWRALPSPYVGSFFGVLPLDGESLLLFGLRGHIYRSMNAGDSWEPIATLSAAMLTNALTLSNGEIVIVGLSGAVLFSDDAGRSFKYQSHTSRMGISAVLELKDNHDLLVTGDQGIKKINVKAIINN